MTNWANDIVLVPACLLCPVLQASYGQKSDAWRAEWLTHLNMRQVSILPTPCPESSFGGCRNGLRRKPHGIRYYEKLEGFSAYCEQLAQETAQQILALQEHGHHVRAIIGIENSPTCAASRIFTYGIGTEHRKGLFLQALDQCLENAGISIPYIGITRHKKNQTKELIRLDEILNCKV